MGSKKKSVKKSSNKTSQKKSIQKSSDRAVKKLNLKLDTKTIVVVALFVALFIATVLIALAFLNGMSKDDGNNAESENQAESDISACDHKETSLENAVNKAHGGAIYLLSGSSTTNQQMLPDMIDGIRAKGYEFAVYHKN